MTLRMRTFIIIAACSICTQAFCINTKTQCELSLISSSPPIVNKDARRKIRSHQTSNIQNKAREFFYTIDSLGLDESTIMALWDENIYYILDLVQWTESNLFNIRRMSKPAVLEVKEKLLTKGLYLGMQVSSKAMQAEAKQVNKKKHSLYVQFIKNIHSMPIDIPRNEFLDRVQIEIKKLNNSHLYRPFHVYGYYNVNGAFKSIEDDLQHSIRLPSHNVGIRSWVLDQVVPIMQSQNIRIAYAI